MMIAEALYHCRGSVEAIIKPFPRPQRPFSGKPRAVIKTLLNLENLTNSFAPFDAGDTVHTQQDPLIENSQERRRRKRL